MDRVSATGARGARLEEDGPQPRQHLRLDAGPVIRFVDLRELLSLGRRVVLRPGDLEVGPEARNEVAEERVVPGTRRRRHGRQGDAVVRGGDDLDLGRRGVEADEHSRSLVGIYAEACPSEDLTSLGREPSIDLEQELLDGRRLAEEAATGRLADDGDARKGTRRGLEQRPGFEERAVAPEARRAECSGRDASLGRGLGTSVATLERAPAGEGETGGGHARDRIHRAGRGA